MKTSFLNTKRINIKENDIHIELYPAYIFAAQYFCRVALQVGPLLNPRFYICSLNKRLKIQGRALFQPLLHAHAHAHAHTHTHACYTITSA